MYSEAQKRAIQKYQRKLKEQGIVRVKHYSLQCHVVNDADVIEFLERQPNKSSIIKDLIRAEISRAK